MQFIAGGRYLYYAGRENKFMNNCYLLKAEEDSREDWANLSWKAESALMTGGGIGCDYSIYRPRGSIINKTGGQASGPIPKMLMINEIGRNVMQGGSRRSAIYASLNWQHNDIGDFLHVKDWYSIPVNGAFDDKGSPISIGMLKEKDFNYPAPLDMTNISLNYDNKFLEEIYHLPLDIIKKLYDKGKHSVFNLPINRIPITFLENCRQALKTGEPGFSFNFFDRENETLRNACITEDTMINTNKGSLSVSEITDRFLQGEEFQILSYNIEKNRVEFQNLLFSGKTRKNAEIIQLELEDGKILKLTPDHKVYTANRGYVEAKDLTNEDDLICID